MTQDLETNIPEKASKDAPKYAPKYAIRFGLGAIKAVGIKIMEDVVQERKENGNFKDIYEFAERVNPKSVNKKSIEALGKAGAFDKLTKNRRQISESFEILSAYSAEKTEEATSNQMSLFGGMPEADIKPALKNVENWNKADRLQKEFEAFGYFLNEHPLDDSLSDLRKRGVIFSDKFESDELEDNSIVKMAGVVASSKHRSSARGRFAYIYISDPYGMLEAMIFDEEIITTSRDLIANGSTIAFEAVVRKDDGGSRLMFRSVTKLSDFIASVPAREDDFEDIVKRKTRKFNPDKDSRNSGAPSNYKPNASSIAPSSSNNAPPVIAKKLYSRVELFIKEREVILDIKSALSQALAAEGAEKSTTVFLCVMTGNKLSKIELPNKYMVDEMLANRFRRNERIVDVEASY